MLSILKYRTYRHLFLAQIIALLGTGLATVALSLLAFNLAEENAGQVIGTALAIKMIVYVLIAPLTSSLAGKLNRRLMLVTLDGVRALAALAIPFVTEIWEIYLLIILLQSASAAFTPTFQATIPDILPDEEDYTRALSLSRLAYDLENLLSPILAAILLMFVTWQGLFVGTVIGFIGSALLIVSVALPSHVSKEEHNGVYARSLEGFKIFLATPRLKGLMILNFIVSLAGAMVIVNTVVLVQGQFGLTESHTAMAFAAFGGGSMVAALCLPLLLQRWSDHRVMLAGAWILIAGLLLTLLANSLIPLMVVWFCLGIGYASVQTPTGRLLTRSSHPEDRPTLFAAQFSLSHAGWLLSYPLAGWLGSIAGLHFTLILFASLGTIALIGASRLWPATDSIEITHSHDDLPTDHPHRAHTDLENVHSHPYIIDDLHPRWPL